MSFSLWVKSLFKKDNRQSINENKSIPSSNEFSETKKLVSVFKDKKILIHKAIAKWYGEPGIDEVLVPVLYAFFDYSLFIHQKDRSIYSKSIEEYVLSKEYKSKRQKEYHMQVLSVFASVVNENKVRGDWWLSGKRSTNPVFSSMLFLGDLLLNKEMIGNYHRAPVMIIDASLLVGFGQIMMNEVYPELMNIFDVIHNLK